MCTVLGKETLTEEEQRQAQAYEEWLYQQNNWLLVQVKHNEYVIGKFRKSKKTLAAKQKQVRRTSNINKNCVFLFK